MKWTIIGLGNPEEKYVGTRHNAGRDFLKALKDDLGDSAKVIIPEEYMNNSGRAVKPVVKSVKAAEHLVVLHDDLDLPLGVVKLSFGRGSGGHKGVESVQRAVKTKNFVRVRIGVSAERAKGRVKKFDVLSKFRPGEQAGINVAKKNVKDALKLLLSEGLEKAMGEIHAR